MNKLLFTAGVALVEIPLILLLRELLPEPSLLLEAALVLVLFVAACNVWEDLNPPETLNNNG